MRAEKIISRSERAFNRKSADKYIYDDIYRYILPYRAAKDPGETKKRLDGLFDSTAVMAAFRFAGRMQSEVTPPMTEWFKLTPGPLATDEQKEQLVRQLKPINAILRAALDTGEFHTASMEMYQDLGAGTGVLFVLPADDDDELVNFVAAPFTEVAIESDSKGHVCGVFWRQCQKAHEWVAAYPHLKWPQEILTEANSGTSQKEYEAIKSLTYNPKADRKQRWDYDFVLCKEKYELDRTMSEYCPAIVPRFFKFPGEDNGRGPFMIALPNVRVANKVVQLILQAAALSVFPIMTVTDDGILNPDKARIEPGAIWNVESNGTGGFGGRSVETLPLGQNLNVSDIVLQDQRAQIKAAMMDNQLPPSTGAVRSPTEIIELQRNQSFDISTAFGRIMAEFVVKLVQRVCEVMRGSNGILPDWVVPDQKIISVMAVGPLSISQKMAEVEKLVQALELSLSIGGMEMTAMIFKIEEIIERIGTLLGVDPDMIRNEIEQQQLMELVAQMLAQSQAGQEAAA